MTLLVRRVGTLGAAILAVALAAVSPAQRVQSDFTKSMGIDQRLGAKVPLDVAFQDETGATRTLGSLLKGRPLLVLPFPLRRTAGCGVVAEGLQKTLARAAHANDHAIFKKEGPDQLVIGKDFDVAFLSLDPAETPTDGAAAKIDFQNKLGTSVEPVTALTGDEASIRRATDALGFRFFHDPATRAMRNPTGAALLTPDGRISSYTIGNDFQTKPLEENLALAKAGRIGTKADDTQMFGCVQLASSVIERRGKIERIITLFALLTLGTVVLWIGSMLRAERRASQSNRQSNVVHP